MYRIESREIVGDVNGFELCNEIVKTYVKW
jgi:hypothetical protein